MDKNPTNKQKNKGPRLTLNGKIALSALNNLRSTMSSLDYIIARRSIFQTYRAQND